MRFHFKETMRGRVENPDGSMSPFEFTITARARGLIACALGEPFDVSGTASLQDISETVTVGGTLLVALPLRRILLYDLSFKAPDGALYRYMGRKDVRYLHFLRTMSWLRGTLFRNGEPVGQAELWFSYRDLPAFILSFRPGIIPAISHAIHRLRGARREST